MKFDEVSYELGRQASGGGGGSAVIESITITQNGTTTAPSGVDGYSPVIVAVPTPTYGTLNVSANGTYTPTAPTDAYNEVVVAVTPTLQNKTALANGTYTADAGYDGLGEVVVNVSGGAQAYDFTGDISYLFASPVSATWCGANLEKVGTFTAITGAHHTFLNSSLPYPTSKSIPLVSANCSHMFEGFYCTTPTVCDNLSGTINGISSMFYNSYFNEIDLSGITFLQGMDISATGTSYLFQGAKAETITLPQEMSMYNAASLFQGCYNLRTITLPANFTFSQIMSGSNVKNSNVFYMCYRLLEIPMNLYNMFVDMAQTNNTGSNLIYGNAFNNCLCVDKINGVHICNYDKTNTTLFASMFYKVGMLDSFTFQSNQTADWNNQTLDLSQYVGWQVGQSDADMALPDSTKHITDQTTYDLYKNERWGWTSDYRYSRYNHDSAVETINSLPTLDTANNKSCTIKFKGAAGSLTDAGSMNTLTASELAVATTKGWTVSLV